MITTDVDDNLAGITVLRAGFCQKCGSILDVNTAIELDEERSKGDDIMSELLKQNDVQKFLVKKLMESGLKDKLMKSI